VDLKRRLHVQLTDMLMNSGIPRLKRLHGKWHKGRTDEPWSGPSFEGSGRKYTPKSKRPTSCELLRMVWFHFGTKVWDMSRSSLRRSSRLSSTSISVGYQSSVSSMGKIMMMNCLMTLSIISPSPYPRNDPLETSPTNIACRLS